MGAPTGRKSRLEEAEYCELLAEHYVSGQMLQDMADDLEVSVRSIRTWVRDPRVQVFIAKLTRDRTNRITRKVDTEIENRLKEVKGMKTEDLLKIRKEFMSRHAEDSKSADTGQTVNELSEAMDSNPDLAEALRKLVGQ